MSDFIKLVGEQIRIIRKSRGMTQEELADKSSLSFSYISDVERGTRNISLESLEKITVALDAMPSQIFNFKDIESFNGLDDKHMLIEILRSLLIERTTEEIKFIVNVTKEFVATVDK